ncbi:MAG: mannitol dehydrogenase family protein [Pseudomonadota bacterium]
MQRLDAETADRVSPAKYQVQSAGVGIVHLGPGAFHRAHQAVFTDDALAYGGDWRIVGVQMRSRSVRDALGPQDYRYTLAVLDEEPQLRVIHALAEVLVLPEDLDAVFAHLTASSTHIVTLTVSEKGYCLNPAGELDGGHPEIRRDLANTTEPSTAIGLVCEALRRRRAAGTVAPTIISCDNLSDNGRLLGAAVRAYAKHIDESLAVWISNNVSFPRTMVDSITPATTDNLRQRVATEMGYEDALPVGREAFSQWVIEDRFSGPRPAWDRAGVMFTEDVPLFETAKLRLLNGAHSALAYAGLLTGYETVRQAVTDEELHHFVRSMMIKEVCPTLRRSEDLDPLAYCDQVLQRFRNPQIEYQLRQVAMDGSQKLQVRLFPTITDNVAAQRPYDRLVHVLAAWLHCLRRFALEDDPPFDPQNAHLFPIARLCTGEATHDVPAFLGQDSFAGLPRADENFLDELTSAYDRISNGGRYPQAGSA